MRPCCPPGTGCNAPGGDEPCALALCRDAVEENPAATVALERWNAWRGACRAHRSGSERRFRRRAFQRARDDALVALAMHDHRLLNV